jgi:subtilisin family serine protease
VNAGNTADDVSPKSSIYGVFAKNNNVILVTSSDEKDNLYLMANTGKEVVTTSAPGTNIFSTQKDGGYGSSSSTALAAAQVAGAVALAIAKYGDTVKDKLRRAAILSGDEVSSMKLRTIGENRLNIATFLDSLQ